MISALMDLIGTFYQNGSFDQVEIIARTISAAVPDDMISLQILGLVCLRTGRLADAQKLFHQAEEIESVAATGGQTGCERAASVCFREATRQGRGFAKLWYDLGLALVRLKRPAQSIKAFRAAIATRPMFPEACAALAAAELQTVDVAAMRAGIAGLPRGERDAAVDRFTDNGAFPP